MSFLRSYVAPFFIVLIFAIAMLAVSARIFLPSDLAAPAPIEEPNTASDTAALGLPNAAIAHAHLTASVFV
ncbi:MAG: hypothetical protein AAGA75_07875 [Cyanobacteria bacterium P01_E01_bin.6]